MVPRPPGAGSNITSPALTGSPPDRTPRNTLLWFARQNLKIPLEKVFARFVAHDPVVRVGSCLPHLQNALVPGGSCFHVRPHLIQFLRLSLNDYARPDPRLAVFIRWWGCVMAIQKGGAATFRRQCLSVRLFLSVSLP